MSKRTVTYSIDSKVLKELDKYSRNQVPNKSQLVEGLLREWLDEHKPE